MEKTLITTPQIQEANETVMILQKHLESILNQKFWQHKISVQEKITYLKEIASSRRTLWQVCTNEYPELNGISYTVNSACITYKPKETDGQNTDQPSPL